MGEREQVEKVKGRVSGGIECKGNLEGFHLFEILIETSSLGHNDPVEADSSWVT